MTEELVPALLLAEKLHNARATLTDLRVIGADAWKPFNASPHEPLWHYGQMTSAPEARIPHSSSVQQLRSTVEAIERLDEPQVVNA